MSFYRLMFLGKPAPVFLLSCFAITSNIEAQQSANGVGQTLPEMISSPSSSIKESSSRWATTLTKTYGKQGAANTLVGYLNQNELTVDQLYVIRQIGEQIQPEFITATVNQLHSVSSPITKGKLLNLLRGSDLNHLHVIKEFLSDARSAEIITKLAAANGAIAFRVCDIAYNVFQEVAATDKSQIILLTRTFSLEERDACIAKVR